jgi:hypothetical protein
MPQEFNPFTEQIAVQYFVGREHQLKQFKSDLNGLRSGMPNHQYVAGLEGAGKTTYLAKLVQIAKDEGFLAVMPTLDARGLSRDHISTILASVVRGVQEMPANDLQLLIDWNSGKDAKYFLHPKTEELKSDRVRADFETLAKFLLERKIPGVVICIDEGQRIDGRAMSVLKNSLQYMHNYLIVISLRLVSASEGAVAAGRDLLNTKAMNEAEGDIGASRFYVTGVPIGPFDSEPEANQCIRLRLAGNIIQFDEDVIKQIGKISDRIPKNMIRLANNLYNLARQYSVQLVDISRLDEAFRSLYQSELLQAMELIANSSSTTRTVIRGLLKVGHACDSTMVCNQVYLGAPPDAFTSLVESVKGELERLSKTCTFILKREENFLISNPVYGYALRLVLDQT